MLVVSPSDCSTVDTSGPMTKAAWPRSQWAPGGEGIEMHARADLDLARARDWRTRNASDEIRIARSPRKLSVTSILFS